MAYSCDNSWYIYIYHYTFTSSFMCCSVICRFSWLTLSFWSSASILQLFSSWQLRRNCISSFHFFNCFFMYLPEIQEGGIFARPDIHKYMQSQKWANALAQTLSTLLVQEIFVSFGIRGQYFKSWTISMELARTWVFQMRKYESWVELWPGLNLSPWGFTFLTKVAATGETTAVPLYRSKLLIATPWSAKDSYFMPGKHWSKSSFYPFDRVSSCLWYSLQFL